MSLLGVIFWIICCYNPVFICAVGMQSGSLKLFATADQKPMLLKRQAFAMFSGELDQYHLYLPLIQGFNLLGNTLHIIQLIVLFSNS